MRRLIAIEFLSLDGVMQGLGSPDEDREGGFEHGGWGAPFAEAIHATRGSSGLETTTGYLFGRRTYEKMATFWPSQPNTNPMAAHLNATPKHVVSATLSNPAWERTVVLTGDLHEEIDRLKSAGRGDVVILGSGVLVRSLLREQMLDGLKLFIHPLLLGAGKRLFGDLILPQALTLKGCDTTPLGSVCLSYETMRP